MSTALVWIFVGNRAAALFRLTFGKYHFMYWDGLKIERAFYSYDILCIIIQLFLYFYPC